MSANIDESAAEPGSPGYRRHRRRLEERAFIKAYREKEADANAKLAEERARRAHTRRLRKQLAEKERLKRKQEARAKLLREKNLRRKEAQKVESEEEYQRRIQRDIELKKRQQLRLEQQQNAGGVSPAATTLALSKRTSPTAAAGFVGKHAGRKSPATSPIRRRLRRKTPSSPRNARQTEANKKWMDNYRRRQRAIEEKKLEAARRRRENVA